MQYYYFNLNGGVISMSEPMAKLFMEKSAPRWRKINTEWGILYCEEYDWYGEVVDGEYQTFPPRLKNGTSVQLNKVAQVLFKEKIIGECFLLPTDENRIDVLTFISKSNIHFDRAS